MNMITLRVAVFALALFAGELFAQAQVQRVADLNTGPNPFLSGSMFSESAVRFGSITLFTATTDRTGRELWMTDGTPQGTRLAFDLCPGRCDGLPTSPELQLVDGLLFFSASDGVHGFEPWVWQAGDAAPRMLVDLNPGAPSSSPRLISSLSFLLGGLPVQRNYLSAERADVGRELWRLTVTDTTTITLERDLAPGPASSSPSSIAVIRNGTALQSAVIGVLATLPGRGQELYGLNHDNAFTAPSSQFLFDLFQNSPRRVLRAPALRVGSNVYLVVQDSEREITAPDREELWVTQGSIGNTQLLHTSSRIEQLTAHPELQRLFFVTRGILQGSTANRLGRSDGTVAGTTVSFDSGVPSNLAALAQRLVYTAASNSTGRVELRGTLGGSAATELIRELRPEGTISFSVQARANVQRTRFFVGFDDRLWSSDGTPAGTSVLAGVIPGGSEGRFRSLIPLSGADVLFGWGAGNSPAEPYFVNGATGATASLGNLAGDVGDSNAAPVATVGGRLLLSANLPGINASLFSLPRSGAGALQSLPHSASFNASLGNHFGREWLRLSSTLLLTDGTLQGSAVLDSVPSFSSLGPDCVVERNGLRYFVAGRFTLEGPQIWRSDGTPAGTVRLTELTPSSGNSAIRECRSDSFETNLARLGDDIVFAATQDSTGSELYRLRPDLSLSLLADINAGVGSSSPGQFVELPGRLLFGADDGVFGRELWTSDGTGQGTRRLTDIHPGSGDALTIDFATRGLIRAGNKVYFAAFNPTSGRELYVSDGTAAGTRLVRDLFAGPGSAFASAGPRAAAAVGDELVFGASTTLGCTLVRSDGSLAGTRCAYDPTRARFGPISEIVATPSGIVVFSAARLDLEQGEEIHALLGDQLLTLSGADIAPGPQSSAPRFLRVDGEAVYFQADDGSTGRELWRVDLGNLSRVFADGFEAP